MMYRFLSVFLFRIHYENNVIAIVSFVLIYICVYYINVILFTDDEIVLLNSVRAAGQAINYSAHAVVAIVSRFSSSSYFLCYIFFFHSRQNAINQREREGRGREVMIDLRIYLGHVLKAKSCSYGADDSSRVSSVTRNRGYRKRQRPKCRVLSHDSKYAESTQCPLIVLK